MKWENQREWDQDSEPLCTFHYRCSVHTLDDQAWTEFQPNLLLPKSRYKERKEISVEKGEEKKKAVNEMKPQKKAAGITSLLCA